MNEFAGKLARPMWIEKSIAVKDRTFQSHLKIGSSPLIIILIYRNPSGCSERKVCCQDGKNKRCVQCNRFAFLPLSAIPCSIFLFQIILRYALSLMESVCLFTNARMYFVLFLSYFFDETPGTGLAKKTKVLTSAQSFVDKKVALTKLVIQIVLQFTKSVFHVKLPILFQAGEVENTVNQLVGTGVLSNFVRWHDVV